MKENEYNIKPFIKSDSAVIALCNSHMDHKRTEKQTYL